MATTMQVGKGLIDPRYCCCAVPLVNAGIYTILGEQAVISIAIGILVLATPDVVGASFPSFAGTIFAILCFVIAACQPVGFIGVLREKTSTFKVYSILNALAILAALACAAALIITSALRHNTAVHNCEAKFFSDSNSTSTTANQTLASESQALCSAFAWADVGIMGGIWLILLLVQGYFLYLTSTYSRSQVSDHKLYHSVYSENPEAFTMSILRSTRYNPGSVYNAMPPPGPNADAWDARPSMESLREEPEAGAAGYGLHHRGYSDAAARGEEGRYEDAYPQHDESQAYGGAYGHNNYDQEYNGNGGGQYPFSAPGAGYIIHPAEARYARDESDTPTANNYAQGQGIGYGGGGYSGATDGGLRRPEEAQSHPGGH
ncbi:hypothetical protein IAR55_005385 [Kwoniella newhampshirensis]|uniref:MARVEL domain-containing protein n=1 Tax=Kwoniella newhampshirensis TaxID=1651941 RepID=A0AAW0YW45_9TREE